MKSATIALNQADQTLRTAQSVISLSSPLYLQVNASLSEIKNAASSIRILSQYLERNPNAVLMGKK